MRPGAGGAETKVNANKHSWLAPLLQAMSAMGNLGVQVYNFGTKSFAAPDAAALADAADLASDTANATLRDLVRPAVKSPRLKRAFDIVVAALVLILHAPLLGFAALAIWVETGGPVLFRQQRTGLGGKPFMILKLRTMTTADNGSSVQQATKGDARVTRVGAILRKLSIDELPQLVNVLVGDMSLVGPRPHALAHDLEFAARVPVYQQRFAVRPGITGLAQVRGLRGEINSQAQLLERTAADLEYAERASLWLDLQIIARTALKLPFDAAAY